MKEQIGYRIEVIPATEVKRCWGCIYHSHHLSVSGRSPIYHSNCNHPDLPDIHKLGGTLFLGNLNGSPNTPDWCPAGESIEIEIAQK